MAELLPLSSKNQPVMTFRLLGIEPRPIGGATTVRLANKIPITTCETVKLGKNVPGTYQHRQPFPLIVWIFETYSLDETLLLPLLSRIAAIESFHPFFLVTFKFNLRPLLFLEISHPGLPHLSTPSSKPILPCLDRLQKRRICSSFSFVSSKNKDSSAGRGVQPFTVSDAPYIPFDQIKAVANQSKNNAHTIATFRRGFFFFRFEKQRKDSP